MKVVIIQKSLPQYRIEFFSLLREELRKKDIDLQLIYGDFSLDNRRDSSTLSWATFKKNRIIKLGNLKFIWQPCFEEIKSANLVIVEQANKLLFNYVLVFNKIFNNKKYSFWGHGSNLQISKRSIFNLIRLSYIKHPTWWFGYTNGVKNYLINQGVAESKITVVQNAIDTRSLNNQYLAISNDEVDLLRTKHKIERGDRVLIYCGALSKEKNIEFLLQAATLLNDKGYRFKLIIIGSGPFKDLVINSAMKMPWLIYVGPQFGRDKALYFKLADMFLLPGAIGLAILDSFAFETPLITTRIKNHGPEFEYLINNYNGIISDANLTDYVNKVSFLLDNPEKLSALKTASKLMIEKYNIQNMVDNFANGIEKALQEK